MFDTFFTILRKGMVLTIFILFGFATVYTPIPHDRGGYHNVEQANAGASVVMEVGSNLIQNTYTAIQTTLQRIYQAWIYLKENVLDGIAWTIAKQFISNMVADIVDWINSGFEGNPAFVQDLDNFLLRAADEAVGQYINELGGLGSFVCDPFRLNVQLAVAIQYDLSREDRVPECTLTDIINNFEDFIEGDFQSGGWAGWFDLTSNPRHTPYGSILTAQTGAQALVANTEGEQVKLLDFGSGFISIPFCENVAGPNGPVEQCSIVNPGDVVRSTLNKSLGAGQDSLVEADEFNEIVVALLGQLSTRVLEGAQGLLGLSGGGGYSYTPYSRGSFADDLRDGTIDGSSGGGTTGDVVGDPGGGGGVSSGLALIQAALSTQNTIIASIDSYRQRLQAFASNTLNDDAQRATALVFLDDANVIRQRVVEGIANITPILNAFAVLDAEYVDATPTRRSEIRNEQAVLLQQFNALNLVSQSEYDVQTGLWDRLLAQNVGPIIPDFDLGGIIRF